MRAQIDELRARNLRAKNARSSATQNFEADRLKRLNMLEQAQRLAAQRDADEAWRAGHAERAQNAKREAAEWKVRALSPPPPWRGLDSAAATATGSVFLRSGAR